MQALLILFAIATTILWLVIGWRAMLAHESISYSVARYVAANEVNLSDQFRSESGLHNRLYKQFLTEEPSRADMSPKDRHEAFRKWSESQE
jgi:hypothetical protein